MEEERCCSSAEAEPVEEGAVLNEPEEPKIEFGRLASDEEEEEEEDAAS